METDIANLAPYHARAHAHDRVHIHGPAHVPGRDQEPDLDRDHLDPAHAFVVHVAANIVAVLRHEDADPPGRKDLTDLHLPTNGLRVRLQGA